MPQRDAAFWTERVWHTLAGYDEPLLREVAGRLVRTRSQWPAEELLMRAVQAVSSPAVLDRRLKERSPAERRVLALIGHSRQPRWPVGSLVELCTALGEPDGLQPVLALLQAGLLFPDLGAAAKNRCKAFATWLTQTSAPLLTVFAPPCVTERALGEDLGLPDLSVSAAEARPAAQEADGLEWPLRLAVLWQQVQAAPLRRTQPGDFFKRDLDRLRGDALLSSPPADSLADLPDVGLLAVAWGLAEGLLQARDGELRAGTFPAAWAEGLPTTVASLWAALPWLESWTAAEGWRPGPRPGNPYPSAYLLALVLLARLPEESWARPEDVASWVIEHHPFWKIDPRSSILECFLLGLAYQLRLLQAAKDRKGGWLVRLSPLGRWVLGLGELPDLPAFTQTLLVQPNLEILAYRQGLSPGLIARLGRFAAWKSLGAACTLHLKPDTVYTALEAGETCETIVQTLEQHSTKELPASVGQLLRTWANKHERISVYAAGTLFEFGSTEDLEEALARGLPAVRLAERLAVVANEAAVDFRHFRLTATRDYTLPPEKCVAVEADGVTLTIDLGRADLLLESEVQRFAETVQRAGSNGRRHYRLTPTSVAAGRGNGLTPQALESWFFQRVGQALSPAARLLLTGANAAAPELRRQLVLHVASEEIADGLQQWPGTRALVAERLGPTALAVAEEHIELLQERLDVLGIPVRLREQVLT
jgi:hypothetical protein